MEIAREVGGYLLSAIPTLRVDVHHPEIVVHVEIREYGAYIHAGQFKGAGGMPVGTNGKESRSMALPWAPTARPCFCFRAALIPPWRAT